MLGAIFGDIAGSIYEFNNIKSTEFDLLDARCEYTDDSILTIAVADWLLEGALSKARLIFTIKQYVGKYPLPMGGYGGRFLTWATRDNAEPYNSWGNGSAMRVSPVGWAFTSLEETERIARLTAEITHNHPEGIKGAQATAAAIFLARTGATKAVIKDYIELKYGYNLSRTCDEIRPNYKFNESCQQTVPEAIIAFLDAVDFESSIRLAISLGGDSDTLACITGGIAEAFYGMEISLPNSYDQKDYGVQFSELSLDKLPDTFKTIVNHFYKKFIIPNKIFWAKNEARTELRKIEWIETEVGDINLSQDSYKAFMKGYHPDWDMRFGVYYEDGWHYIYRSNHLLKKFRFEQKEDGNYHIVKSYCSGHTQSNLIEEVLRYGYFEPPYYYNKSQERK